MKTANILIRVILIFVGLTGITGFGVPFLTRRILNLGNLTGLIVSGSTIFYSIFMPKINSLIYLIWKKRVGKNILSLLMICLIVVIVLVIAMSVLMISAATSKPAQNSTVIVLGCKVYGERPSLMLIERMDAAIKYLNDNPKSKCIVSGGQGNDEDISEAECMYRYLIDNGISHDRIYKEDKSTSTRENIEFSYKIIQKYGLSEKIAIATNEFHEYRAGKIADSIGLTEHGSIPGKTVKWLFPTYYVRELYAIMYEWLLN